MSKIFADVRDYQDQAHAAGFYHTTNLVLSYLHVQILASRHFDSSDWSGERLVGVEMKESLCSLRGPDNKKGQFWQHMAF